MPASPSDHHRISRVLHIHRRKQYAPATVPCHCRHARHRGRTITRGGKRKRRRRAWEWWRPLRRRACVRRRPLRRWAKLRRGALRSALRSTIREIPRPRHNWLQRRFSWLRLRLRSRLRLPGLLPRLVLLPVPLRLQPCCGLLLSVSVSWPGVLTKAGSASAIRSNRCPNPTPSGAVVDCATNVEQQIGAISRPSHLLSCPFSRVFGCKIPPALLCRLC